MEEIPLDVALFRKKKKSGIIYEQLVGENKFLILSSIKEETLRHIPLLGLSSTELNRIFVQTKAFFV